MCVSFVRSFDFYNISTFSPYETDMLNDSLTVIQLVSDRAKPNTVTAS